VTYCRAIIATTLGMVAGFAACWIVLKEPQGLAALPWVIAVIVGQGASMFMNVSPPVTTEGE
jgi:hypothetical protein